MSELDEQQVLVEWFEMQYPHHRLIVSANGGLRNKIVASKLKRSGVRAGVPDICIPVARAPYHALYIEFKPRVVSGKKRGVTSLAQKQWIKYLNEQGNLALTVYGFDEAVMLIKKYLAPIPGCMR